MNADLESRIDAQVLDGVKKALMSGKPVHIYGWLGSNHDKFTRSLDPRLFRFEPEGPKTVPAKAGFIITTERAAGQTHKFIRKRSSACSGTPLSTGRIKRLLEDAVAAVPPKPVQPPREEKPKMPAPSAPPAPPAPATSAASAKVSGSADVPSAAHAPDVDPAPGKTREEREKAFAKSFMQAVGGDIQKTVSKYVASNLLKEHFEGAAVNPSAQKKLMEPVIAEGRSRAGQYRATARLIELAGAAPEVEPSDIVERAKWLVAREPTLLARKKELESELGEFDTAQLRELEAFEAEQQRQRGEFLNSQKVWKGEFYARHSNEVGVVENQLIRCEKARRHLEGLEKL